jgi:hypothetical protein
MVYGYNILLYFIQKIWKSCVLYEPTVVIYLNSNQVTNSEISKQLVQKELNILKEFNYI